MQRITYVKQLIFSKTRLEFRLLWNKIFQKEDEELGWLLNPYKQANGSRVDATMMSSFNKNNDDSSYQYGYDDVSGVFGRERVTIYNRGIAKKSDRRKKREDNRTLGEKALDIARYMGMGVYMTSTAFPSPFLPVNDTNLHDDSVYGMHNTYRMSKMW